MPKTAVKRRPQKTPEQKAEQKTEQKAMVDLILTQLVRNFIVVLLPKITARYGHDRALETLTDAEILAVVRDHAT